MEFSYSIMLHVFRLQLRYKPQDLVEDSSYNWCCSVGPKGIRLQLSSGKLRYSHNRGYHHGSYIPQTCCSDKGDPLHHVVSFTLHSSSVTSKRPDETMKFMQVGSFYYYYYYLEYYYSTILHQISQTAKHYEAIKQSTFLLAWFCSGDFGIEASMFPRIV